MLNRLLASLRIRTKLLLLLIGGNLVTTVLLTALVYQKQRDAILEGYDRQLLGAANALPFVLGEDFLSRIHPSTTPANASEAIPQAVHEKAIRSLREFSRSSGVAYVYAVVRDDRNRIFIAAINETNVEYDGDYPPLFASYKVPPDDLHTSFNTGRTQLAAEYEDGFDRYRSMFVPFRNRAGRLVVLCADVKMVAIEERLMWTAIVSITVGLFSSLIFSVLLIAAVGRLSDLLGALVTISSRIREGNLAEALRATRNRLPIPPGLAVQDEVLQLQEALCGMTKALAGLTDQVKGSTSQLLTTTNQMRGASSAQARAVGELGRTSTDVAESTRRLGDLSTKLVREMTQAGHLAHRTESLANQGQDPLRRMEESVESLEGAHRRIATQLQTIQKRAEQITKVVTAIEKIVEQTNLLSLNAAIEAEKAGEYGKGFAVVARQIRRLADQTDISAGEIGREVQAMQSAVTRGVMDMEKFTGELGHSLQETTNAGLKMHQIIESLGQLLPRFDTVRDHIQEQDAETRSIAESARILRTACQTTQRALSDFEQPRSQLDSASQELETAVGHFR